MTENAIIVHGMPGQAEFYDPDQPAPAHHHWLPWLANQLLVRGILAQTPQMPDAFRPDYAAWSREFERFEVTAATYLAGHSCGAGFLTRWLSEHPAARPRAVLLAAPFLDPTGLRAPHMFGGFTLDPGFAERAGSVAILHSDDDGTDIQRSVAILRAALPTVRYVEVPARGHLADGPGTALPEALPLLGLDGRSPIAPE